MQELDICDWGRGRESQAQKPNAALQPSGLSLLRLYCISSLPLPHWHCSTPSSVFAWLQCILEASKKHHRNFFLSFLLFLCPRHHSFNWIWQVCSMSSVGQEQIWWDELGGYTTINLYVGPKWEQEESVLAEWKVLLASAFGLTSCAQTILFPCKGTGNSNFPFLLTTLSVSGWKCVWCQHKCVYLLCWNLLIKSKLWETCP